MLQAHLMSEAGGGNNTKVHKNEAEIIIKKIHSANKPSQYVLYFFFLFSALLAMLVEINMFNNYLIDSVLKFSFTFSLLSLFFLFFYSFMHKTSIMSGLFVVNQWIDCLSRNDWNHPFPWHLHKSILIHPIFKVVAGLYLCEAGYDSDGMAMIDKAASEMPVIYDCVSEGKISSTNKFLQLSNIIKNDLMPKKGFIIFFKVFLAIGSLSILLRFIFYALSFVSEYIDLLK